MKNLIADASPLIFLAKAGLIDILKRLCKKVYVTSYVMSELEKPITMGFSAPEVDIIKNSNIIVIKKLTAKEIVRAKKLSKKSKIGMGESESAILFKRGQFSSVLVADIRAQREMKNMGINTTDLIDLGFIAAKKGIMNPRRFALKLWDNAHFRSERVRNVLGKKKISYGYR